MQGDLVRGRLENSHFLALVGKDSPRVLEL